MSKPTYESTIKWLRLRGEQDRADAIEAELEQARKDADEKSPFWKDKYRYQCAVTDQLNGKLAAVEGLPTYTIDAVLDDPGGLNTVVTQHEPKRRNWIKRDELEAILSGDNTGD